MSTKRSRGETKEEPWTRFFPKISPHRRAMASAFRSSCLAAPAAASSRYTVSQLSSNLKIPRWKLAAVKKRYCVARASSKGLPGPDDNNAGAGFSCPTSNVFEEEAIGAEYGEGFETFRMDGPLKVDVDYLNDKLQESFLQRIRHAMKPDETYGLIFSWDNVVADTCSLKLSAWEQLATEEGKDIPRNGQIYRSMLHMAADDVLHRVLFWGDGAGEMERLKSRLVQIYHEDLLKLTKPVQGLKEWLEALYTAGTPCAVVSCLDRRSMIEALDRMDLRKYFQAVVSEEDGMESIAHRFLSAAIKLDRKPSKCIVFEDDPRGITAAHNCTMMAIGLIGAHRAYELVQADLTVGCFSDLSVINLRRLFAHKGFSFMDPQKQIVEKAPPRRKLTIDTIF